MQALALASPPQALDTERFARCLTAARRVRWDLEADVVRGRGLDPAHGFLPEALSGADELDFLDAAERRLLSQVQGRTYANVMALLERFVAARMVAVSRRAWQADPIAREALASFGAEEAKHEALFRRIDRLADAVMEEGYRFPWEPDEIARLALGRSGWAGMALALMVGLLAQAHAHATVSANPGFSPLMRDVLLYHWREESQHAALDELEWRRLDAALTRQARELAADDLADLLAGFDAILRAQAEADAGWFVAVVGHELCRAEACAVRDALRAAYRGLFIRSGAGHPHFQAVLCELATEDQRARIDSALARLGE